MRARRLKTVKVIFALFFVVCSLMLFSHKAHAASWSNPIVSTTTQMASNESYQDSAVNMTVNVKGMPLAYSASVTKGLHIWLARYTDTQTYRSYWAVKSPYDQYFVNLTGVPNDLISLVPGTDTLTWDQYTGNYNFGGLVTTRDGWKALQLSFADGKPYYSLDPSRAKQWFIYKDYNNNQTQLRVTSRAISSNGRYVLAWIGYDYYVRLDLDTNAIQYIGRFSGAWYGGPAYNPYAGAITSDGRYVFIYGGPQVVDVNGCGVALAESQVVEGVNMTALQGCSTARLSDAVQEKVGYAGYDSGYHWSDGGDSLVFFVNPFPYTPGGGPVTKVALRLNPETASTVEYLALGDSYSSGEGDIEEDSTNRRNHYLPLTDLGEDRCHISSRSYPFLLRDYWHIDSSGMKSVACSGAQVLRDYDRPLRGYFGQNNRLRGRSDIDDTRQVALDRFIPGRIPQLEFVKKYKPKVITLTGGGNDVGFASMLSYCAYGSADVGTPWKKIKEGFYGIFTCDYAKPNSVVQQLTLKAIDDQYLYTVRLLEQIKAYDSDAKVYMIGYPSFISPGTAICANSLELDSDERAAIQYYLDRLNGGLRRAAELEGVQYVDISDSLKGGRLCEGSEYMTGPWDIDFSEDSALQNIFHPNALGHQKIARTIYDTADNPTSLSAESSIGRPSSVGDTEYSGIAQNIAVTSSDLPRNGNTIIATDMYLFLPASDVKLTLHSNPIDLGVLKAGVDGDINQQINLRNLPVGYHVLILEGTSYSGEPLTVYQFVTVGLDEDKSLLASTDAREPTKADASVGDSRVASSYEGLNLNSRTTNEGQYMQISQDASEGGSDMSANKQRTTGSHQPIGKAKDQSWLWFVGISGVLVVLSIIYIWRGINNAKTAKKRSSQAL